MSKARDLANAGTALTTVSATELGYLDGVTSAVQTQINAQIPKSIVTAKGDILAATGSGTVVAQAIGTDGHVLTADSAQADGLKWAALPASGPEMVTAKVPSGSAGGTYTFTKTFGAGTWLMSQSQAGVTTLGGISVSTADSSKNAPLTTSAASATINVQPVAAWENLDGTITNNATATIEKLGIANGFFYASSSDNLVRSSDGTTWTAANLTGMTAPVVFYNGVYVAGNYTSSFGRIHSSTDGINWTQRVSSFSGNAGYPPYSAAVAPNATNKFLVGGNGGFLYRSADGVNWTNIGSTPMGSQRANSIASDGNSTYVVVGDGGKIITSTDGANFTTRTSGTSNNLASVAYGNGLYVACGESGVIRTSTDGATWTTVTGLGTQLNSVFYASGQTYPWVILAQNGNIYYSTNGSTWVGPISTGPNNASNYFAGIYFNGKYRITGGTNNTTGQNQYKASTSVFGSITSDFYSTFIGPSSVTTVS